MPVETAETECDDPGGRPRRQSGTGRTTEAGTEADANAEAGGRKA
jgi:hypothetical protein